MKGNAESLDAYTDAEPHDDAFNRSRKRAGTCYHFA
jgi:hypothetical protein